MRGPQESLAVLKDTGKELERVELVELEVGAGFLEHTLLERKVEVSTVEMTLFWVGLKDGVWQVIFGVRVQESDGDLEEAVEGWVHSGPPLPLPCHPRDAIGLSTNCR